MTTVKSIVEHRDILNFNRDSISKSFVRQTIRKTKFDHIVQGEAMTVIVINHITVGMYHIQLCLGAHGGLRNFTVQIRDSLNVYKGPINLNKDSRFNTQNWSRTSLDNRLNTENLVDIIMHCHRLNKMKVFL